MRTIIAELREVAVVLCRAAELALARESSISIDKSYGHPQMD